MTAPTTHAPTRDEVHEHDLGLQHDLGTLERRGARRGMGRRGVLGVLGGLGVVRGGRLRERRLHGDSADLGHDVAPAGRAAAVGPDGGPGGRWAATPRVEVADGEIPEETAGPYPGDGSNGPNVLTESGVVRSDITDAASARASGVAEGVPLTVRLKVYDLTGDDVDGRWPARRSTPGTATADGATRCTTATAVDENYLRGVQEADADGWVEFTTHLPGLLRRSLAARALRGLRVARRGDRAPPTSCAPPSSPSRRTSATSVYATEGYEASVANLRAASASTPTASSATATRCRWRR